MKASSSSTTETTNMTPSTYQLAALEEIKRNESLTSSRLPRRHLLLSALAGSGKTTTAQLLIESLPPHLSIAYIAYNAATVALVKDRLPKHIKCATAHAFGLSALKRKYPLAKLNKSKLYNLLGNIHVPEHLDSSNIVRLATLLKENAVLTDIRFAAQELIAHHDFELSLVNDPSFLNCALELLNQSNIQASVYDFSDMLYRPLLDDLSLEQFDYVFIDEAQDTNTARQLLYSKMLKPWGSLVIIGDTHQAIYGFNGADAFAMENLANKFSPVELPLPICYRCSTSVIIEAQTIVPEIQAASDAVKGSVLTLDLKPFLAGLQDLKTSDAVLCRYNAPLVKLFFALIRRGIPTRIEGRDIATGMLKLFEKLKRETLEETKLAVGEWATEEAEKLTEKTKHRLDYILDKEACLLAVVSISSNVEAVERNIRKLFNEEDDALTLSTVHKAKGKEWNRVFIYGRNLMPSERAEKEWQLVQEENLIYVAITRAKLDLVYVNGVKLKGN